MNLYKYATDSAPYQFLYVNFLAPVDHMFYRSFEARLLPKQTPDEPKRLTQGALPESTEHTQPARELEAASAEAPLQGRAGRSRPGA